MTDTVSHDNSRTPDRTCNKLLETFRHRAKHLAAENVNAVSQVGVVGAGLMGQQIAALHLATRISCIVYDIDPSRVKQLHKRVATLLERCFAPGCDSGGLLQQLRGVSQLAELANCDLIFESAVESTEVKQQIFQQLAAITSPTTIVATNTSTIPIGQLPPAELGHRFCGVHFLHPVWDRKIVEVIPSSSASKSVLSRITGHLLAVGRVPILVPDTPGFVVNRLLLPILSSAMELLTEGLTPELVDDAAIRFGMAMGPLRILDEIGLDVAFAAGQILWQAFPNRVRPSPVMVAMIKQKLLGRKTRVGFYCYQSDQPWHPAVAPNTSLEKILSPWRNPTSRPQDDTEIVYRLLLPAVAEAFFLLEEFPWLTSHHIDAAMVLGLGFPAKEEGLLPWASKLGAAFIVSRLREFGWTENDIPSLLLRAEQRRLSLLAVAEQKNRRL